MPGADWNDENTRIICELFLEQVRAGNRPNTHLNNKGYREVAIKFQQKTQLLYTKMQLKNKWDKLKSDYITWKKLLIRGAGSGLDWDSAKGTFIADDDWWKKINKELKGARRWRNGGMQEEDKLKVIFDYITSDGTDHSLRRTYGLASAPDIPRNGVDHSPQAADSVPSAPGSHMNGGDHSPLAADGLLSASDSPMNGVDHLPLIADGFPSAPESAMNGGNLYGLGNDTEDNGGTQLEHEHVSELPSHRNEPPSNRNEPGSNRNEPGSNRNKRRPTRVNANRNKKSKSETTMLMQTHLQRIAELANKAQTTFEKFTSQDDLGPSIQDVMTLVRECGARSGSNEHFIATELFVNAEQREMFMTMETAEERFQWLRRKYIVKYLSSTGMGLR